MAHLVNNDVGLELQPNQMWFDYNHDGSETRSHDGFTHMLSWQQ